MKVVDIKRSFEQCAEVGWRGYDVFLDSSVTPEFVRYLAARGTLLFLEDLKTPFFRITTGASAMKGACGADRFRVGFQSDDDEAFLRDLSDFVGRFSS